MKKVFITGATGLLGSTIARMLITKGYSVKALKRQTSKLDLLGQDAHKIEWVVGDISDAILLEEAMQDCDWAIHSAALISFTKSDAQKLMDVNFHGTANVMNAALGAGIKRMLHVSSVAAFGRPKGVSIIDEQLDIKDSKDNYNYYRSKFYGEREAFRAHAEGLDVLIINPSTILGGGYWDMEPNRIFQQVDLGLPFYTTGVNGFVDVRDVAKVATALLESELSGEKYIVSATNASFKEVMWQIADELKTKRPDWRVTKLLAEIAWRADALTSKFKGTKPLITKEVASVARENFQYSNQKITQSIGYKFMPLSDTIRDTAALYLTAKKSNVNFSIPKID
jgi:dihydroflavonol-4-reductase